MRRALFSLVAAGLVGLFAGCCHTHGVCDCDVDDHCSTRQPWLHRGGAPVFAPLGAPLHQPRPATTPAAPEKEKARALPAPPIELPVEIN